MLYTYKEDMTYEEILNLIRDKRNVMLKIVDRYGFHSEKSLKCGQELDVCKISTNHKDRRTIII